MNCSTGLQRKNVILKFRSIKNSYTKKLTKYPLYVKSWNHWRHGLHKS